MSDEPRIQVQELRVPLYGYQIVTDPTLPPGRYRIGTPGGPMFEGKFASGPPPAETVRAWVARDHLWPATGLYLTEPQPRNTGNDLFWVSEGRWIELPYYWFPTLAPGECWPVEIRRIKE